MIGFLRTNVIPITYGLLPSAMASREATAMLIAISYQEARCTHRAQIMPNPATPPAALGLWQFEAGGATQGVLSHPDTGRLARQLLVDLQYRRDLTVPAVHAALRFNDVLACGFARLLLWTLPDPLPGRNDREAAFAQYLEAWRPGRPHPATWPEAWRLAWNTTEETEGEV